MDMIVGLVALVYNKVKDVVVDMKNLALKNQTNKLISLAIVLAVIYYKKNVTDYLKMILKFVKSNLKAVQGLLLKNRLVTLVVVAVVGYYLYKRYEMVVRKHAQTAPASIKKLFGLAKKEVEERV